MAQVPGMKSEKDILRKLGRNVSAPLSQDFELVFEPAV
jgi:hypothetical protein